MPIANRTSLPKTPLDKKFLLIARQVMGPYGYTSDRAISRELGLSPDFINHVSHGHRSVSQATWEALFAKYPEARALDDDYTTSNTKLSPTSVDITTNSPVLRDIICELNAKQFNIPRSQPTPSKLDFPAYLTTQLDHYVAYYQHSIQPHVDSVRKNGRLQATSLQHIIVRLTEGIKNTIHLYYEGKLLQAAQTFHETLNTIGIEQLTSVETFPEGRTFYRARYSADRPLTRKELFHNPFENRGIVSTNRYSIPGLPALYLGDSTYVCWEEYNRKDFRNLYFSRFSNTEPLKMVKIQRLPDLITQLSDSSTSEERRMNILARYLSLFPLSIACSIRTRSTTDVFKPEYIIPQLLLQYVTDLKGKGASGIMYPSTKVDYTKVKGVPAYNYVFPVRQIPSKGYCSDLARIFTLTNPTSSELETLTYFNQPAPLPLDERLNRKLIRIAEETTSYADTTFGFLERVLQPRPTAPISPTA
jgi:hypothetical protein